MTTENEFDGRIDSVWYVFLTTILFVVLKAFDKIEWSWWWVFSPIWIWVLTIVILGFILALVEEAKK